MNSVELPIDLSSEERSSVSGLFGHDGRKFINELKCELADSESVPGTPTYDRAQALISHLENIGITIELLNRQGSLSLEDNYSRCMGKDCERRGFFRNLQRIFPGRLPVSKRGYRDFTPGKLEVVTLSPGASDAELVLNEDGFPEGFLSYDFILHSAIFNLVKNGMIAQNNDKENAEVTLSTIYQDGFPENPVYVPERARNHSRFVAFQVHDAGRGFPEGKDLTNYFKREAIPRAGYEEGFGTYFIGLVARVFQAPISVTSKQGDTTVTFHHPVYGIDTT